MGHIRLGELPKTRRWSQVVALMDDEDTPVADVAKAIVEAAEQAYRAAGADPGLVQSLRSMAVVADASRQEDFAGALRASGFEIEGDEDAIRLLRVVLRDTESRFGPTGQRTVFTELALAALQESLTATVASQTGSLFLSGLEDAQLAYRAFSTERGFARLAHGFFSRLLARSLKYFTDQAAANRLGSGGRLNSESGLRDFNDAIDKYGREAARIVEDYAGAWYSKRRWLGDVDQTEGLAALAMRKVADELGRAS